MYKRGLGPTPDQLFMQSNYGIVTKMGVWLMPQPECYMPLLAPRLERRRPRPARGHAAELMLDRTIENVPSDLEHARHGVGAVDARTQWYDGEDPIPDDVIDTIARELGLGRWMMRFALYGDEAVVDHQFAKIKEAFEQIPARRCGARSTRPTTPDAAHPRDGSRAACRTSI